MSDTVIILQDECVLVAEGNSGKVPEVVQTERIAIDSFLDPFEQWKEVLRKYKENHKLASAKLVLPASYSMSKVVRIPYAKGKQRSRMAANVLAENQTGEILDYAVISEDKKEGICLCCGGAEEAVLHKVQKMAQELEIFVPEITIPMEAYLRVLVQSKELQKRTAIVLLFEEGSLTSILLRDGNYLYSTRNRIFSERGTLDFGTEIVRTISGILQFYATTKSEASIEKIYYAGCSRDDFIVSEDGIRSMKLEAASLEEEIPFEIDEDGGVLCTGAFISDKKREINLQTAWKRTAGPDGAELKRAGIWKQIQFPVLTFALCLAGVIGVTIWNQGETAKLRRIEQWINDPRIQKSYEKANALKEESDLLAAAQRQVEEMTKNLETYPDPDRAMIEKIEDVSGRDLSVRVKTLDLESGMLTFDAVSKQVIDIPGYIEKLYHTGLFSSVNYSGYSYTEGKYSLVLSCVLEGIETGGEEE